jgi:DNA-directed RNA polymerase subunit H
MTTAAQKFSPTTHQMVPKHEILTAEERKEVLEMFGVEKEQLPKMLDSDAVCKEIGAKKGDILRILRKSETGGESVYYRVVISE